ncbi:MAG: ribonuclease P protein subunit [archaeon]
MLNLKDLEYLGKNVKIINSSDLSKIGICGFVINETKEILVIRTKKEKLITIKKKEILKMDIM